MKKTFLRVIFIIFITFGFGNNINAYTSSELININVTNPLTLTNVYTVPNGFDLIINKITTNTGQLININDFLFSDNTEYKINLVIEDSINIISNPGDINILISGFLVNEDEDIENYIEGNSNGWSKNIFTKEDIDFIYFREFIFFIFLLLIKFFEILIGRKMLMR